MRYIIRMKILERAERLSHNTGRLVFSDVLLFLFDDVIEKFPTCTVIDDKETYPVSFPGSVELDDVGVVLKRE